MFGVQAGKAITLDQCQAIREYCSDLVLLGCTWLYLLKSWHTFTGLKVDKFLSTLPLCLLLLSPNVSNSVRSTQTT